VGRAPVYLVTGDDELLVHRAVQDLVARLSAAEPDLEVIASAVVETPRLPELRTGSLFGGGRCVVIRDAQDISGALADDVKAYLESPEPEATLVLAARGTARIQVIAKRAAEVGERIDVAAPKPWDQRGWRALVTEEFTRLGREASATAVDALLAQAGNDASGIAASVGQVAATAPPGPVSVAHVDPAVAGHGNKGGFAIADAVADRDPASAIVALRGALEAGEEPLAILGALTFRFRELLQARAGIKPERSSEGQFKRLQGIAKRFNGGELAWCYDRIGRCDVDLKGSDLPSDLIIEVAVLELATSHRPGPPWVPAPA